MLFNGQNINEIITNQVEYVSQIETYVELLNNVAPYTEKELQDNISILAALNHLKTIIEAVHETSH